MNRKKRSRRHPLYPEPGTWVLDQSKGLPVVNPPEPLPREGTLSAGTIRDDYVAHEGLGYCIYTYIPPEKIGDPKLRRLWRSARKAMQEVVDYLERTGPAHGTGQEFRTSRRKPKRPKSRPSLAVEDTSEELDGPLGEVVS